MVMHCKQAQTMVKWEKMYGNAWTNMFKLWWRVALWPIHVCRVWKVTLSFNNLNFSHVERVATHYNTLQTWIGHNATRYHSFNALPHVWPYISVILTGVGNALPHALPYIFSEICLFLDYLQRVTTCYRQFFKKIIHIHFFINLTVTRGNTLQIAPKPC